MVTEGRRRDANLTRERVLDTNTDGLRNHVITRLRASANTSMHYCPKACNLKAVQSRVGVPGVAKSQLLNMGKPPSLARALLRQEALARLFTRWQSCARKHLV